MFVAPIALFILAILSDPVVAQQRDDLGICLSQSTPETVDRNIAACTRAITNPKTSRLNVAVAYGGRCAEWIEKKDYARALDDCDQAIKINPKLKEAIHTRGVAYEFNGNQERALADYRTAAALGLRQARELLQKRGLAP